LEPIMPVPLSRDLRERIVRVVESGSSIRQAALRFQVSPSAAVKLMRRVRETGSAAPARFGGHRRPLLEPYDALLAELADGEDTTLAEIQAELRQRLGLTVCLATIHVRLRRLGLRHKKSR
jgi:putative transposase